VTEPVRRPERRGADTVRYWCKYAEAEIVVDNQPSAKSSDLGGAHRYPSGASATLVVGRARSS
jgi:hypothetical protein